MSSQPQEPSRRLSYGFSLIAEIVTIDIAAPLIAYSLLRSAGMNEETAQVLSGMFPHWAWPLSVN